MRKVNLHKFHSKILHLVLFLIGFFFIISVVNLNPFIQQSKPKNSFTKLKDTTIANNTTTFTIDPSSTYNYWNEDIQTTNSSLTIDGASNSFELFGTTRFNYFFSTSNSLIQINKNSTFTFSWLFTSYSSDYIGIFFYFATGNLLIPANFHFTFYNSSTYGIYPYNDESIFIFNNHSINLYQAYYANYNTSPPLLYGIGIANLLYSTHNQYLASQQTTFFRNFSIYNITDSSNSVQNPISQTNVTTIPSQQPTITQYTFIATTTSYINQNYLPIFVIIGGIGIAVLVNFYRLQKRPKYTNNVFKEELYSRPSNFCINCGNPIASDDIYCENCGTKLI